ncbi:PDZ domain-containing protein [Paenibacillus sp. CAA11]|uniref:PDZ domain-containing protein n=1 Tax=Paenibacillus sp. CAA11 TaxID=1532905 RepID=UPI00131F322A|nr:PDZ domain-containing protein [Paenibacillus sp. CAA11]
MLEWLWTLTDALVQLLAQPFYYISILLIALQYRRQVLLERRLFHVRLHSWVMQTLRTMLGGLLAGLGVSAVSLAFGMTLSLEGVLMLWAVSIVLMLLQIRYLCLAYAVGVLGIAQFVVNRFPSWTGAGWGAEVLSALRELNIPALLALAALLHIAEALLVRWQGASFAGPLFYEGKRGKPVGGFQMQSFWPVPLLLLVPAQTAGSVLPWTPLFGGDAWQGGFSLLGLPVIIGFSEMTRSALPKAKARLSSGRLLAYGLLLLALALFSRWYSPLMPVAALVAFLLHEGLIWYSRFEEHNRSPIFVHSPRGLKVLAVLPDSPAEKLGIASGEVISRVNGMKITTKEDLHAALRLNPAFCKLEVLNLSGESKFLQRAIFAGEHHQLGVILAPDEDAPAVLRPQSLSLLQLLSPRRGTRRMGREAASGKQRPAGPRQDELHNETGV